MLKKARLWVPPEREESLRAELTKAATAAEPTATRAEPAKKEPADEQGSGKKDPKPEYPWNVRDPWSQEEEGVDYGEPHPAAMNDRDAGANEQFAEEWG